MLVRVGLLFPYVCCDFVVSNLLCWEARLFLVGVIFFGQAICFFNINFHQFIKLEMKRISFYYYNFGFILLISTYLRVQLRDRTIQSTCALWVAKALRTVQFSYQHL